MKGSLMHCPVIGLLQKQAQWLCWNVQMPTPQIVERSPCRQTKETTDYRHVYWIQKQPQLERGSKHSLLSNDPLKGQAKHSLPISTTQFCETYNITWSLPTRKESNHVRSWGVDVQSRPVCLSVSAKEARSQSTGSPKFS